MDLQSLFPEQILHKTELNPGYDDHASFVWLVQTHSQEVVVRASRMIDEPSNDFWWGCKRIFGIDPRNVHALEMVNNVLYGLGSIPVPRVKLKGYLKQEVIVVEKLNGQVVRSFLNQPASLLESLGEGIAKIHAYKVDGIGNPSGTFRVPQKHFHQHLLRCIQDVVDKFYLNQPEFTRLLPTIIDILDSLPIPPFSSFVMVDMDATQFLSDGHVITGLVDTEAYVIAPREFDLIALEYILDERAANDFKRGYEKVLQFPDLGEYRLPYRFLYRLLAVQGHVDLETWINHPKYF